MQAGCYTLDLYCDAKNEAHEYKEFPHQFFDEYGRKCRKAARKMGWRIGKGPDDKDLCPKCSGKKPPKEKTIEISL